MNNKKKIVYVGLAADIIHKGHIDLLKFASKYGSVVVGLLTDKAIASYKRFPHLSYDNRFSVIKNLKYVNDVIPQHSLDYTDNLKIIKPDFVAHGDDWRTGVQKNTRLKVIKTLKKWSGKLVEKKYTKNISSSLIKNKIKEIGTTPDVRRSKFKRLLKAKKIVRLLECHSPLSGLIAENINFTDRSEFCEFDGMWSSSLTDSASRGMPDNQSLDYSNRINNVGEILNSTTKPLVFDIDNGGRIEHLPNLIKKLDNLGVSAIIMEDKIGLKKNSLFKDQSGAKQDTIKNFCLKIKKAKSSTTSGNFMVISRIESFILGESLNFALRRAHNYVKSGTDGIMIHSKDNNPKKIFAFCKKFRSKNSYTPLIAVPSTYSKTYEKDLIKNGINVVIYANQMLRASYFSMNRVAKKILSNKRAFEADKDITPVGEIIDLIK